MRYLLHNKLTKYMYVHVHYTTAKVNSFFFLLIDLKTTKTNAELHVYLFCVFFYKKIQVYMYQVIYLCNYFKAEIDNWQGDL